ncbi:alpha-2 macroglobulin family-like protein [Micromonas commoda]|uniref:Alpha-2 macroglobulin family-like protein n=1 Tax=Micromonas commoda (strain RCC299 / NOUM17 / CCMP2709) TaxID=296587 RepID=C1DZE0_MICCC|nr:alpha-2 macroglobulin family-like protein [Micromonas commoda]ACO61102.1 alpha-2 macroglobulin family-like protein [Micromonas commoda]|eukprot:XP_002499844.1 alpha-2 macroglobulin family-like protein [Micromonas commoda]
MTGSWKTLVVVFATAIFALAPAVGAVQPLVLAPAKITVGATVGLLVNGAATAGGLKADLMDSADKVIASVTAPPGSGDAQTVQLAVPSSAPPGSARIKIYKTSAPATAFATHAVTLIKAENMDVSALIIETDKPVYKPGQTVQVRVLSLTSKGLKPRSAKVTLTVKDPSDFIVFRRELDADASGVVTARMPTSVEPPLGKYTVEASATDGDGDGTVSGYGSFTLDRYVLPSFHVEINPDSTAVFRGQAKIEGEVKAKYTYGEDMSGTYDVTVWQREGANIGFGDAIMAMPEPDGRERPSGTEYRLIAEKKSQPIVDGSARFSLDVSAANINFGWGWGSNAPELVVEATVRDAATGRVQNGSIAVAPKYNAYDLNLISSSGMSNAIKPGLPIELTLEASTHDGKPFESTFPMKVTTYKMDWSDKSTVVYQVTTKQASDGKRAVGKFTVNVPAQDPRCCWENDLTSYRSESCCITSVEVSNDAMATSSKSMAASVVSFDTVSSADSLVPTVSWSGRVASTTSFGDYVTTSGVPSDPVSVGQSVKFRIASTFTPSSSKFTWAVLSESKGVVATGLAAQNTDVLFQVTESMKPSSVLLVYSPWDGTDTEDTNVVACAKSFEVSPASAHAFPQNLTVSLSSAEVRPGAKVTLETRATAVGSKVYVLAYDTAVAIQAGGISSALTKDRVIAATSPTKSAAAVFGGGSSCYPPADIDSNTIAMVTKMKTSKCTATGGGMMPRGGDVMFAMEEAMAMDAPAVMSGVSSKAGNKGDGLTAVTRVRSFFPETWVWVDVDTDAGTGLATLPDLVAPDSMTTWQFAAFSTHPTDGLAVADESAASSQLKVFKPFFVSPNLPYSAIRGEDLVVRVGVFNYLERALDVTVEIASSPDFDVVSSGGPNSVVSVAAKATGTAAFTIRPKKLGDVDVQISGRTSADVGHADAVKRSVRIEPEGFPREATANAVVNRPSGGAVESVTLSSLLPSAGVVEGSVRSTFAVVGDLMGPSVNGLDRLVQVPYGCGEQNMITMAPNVAAISYLNAARRLTSELKQRAEDNIAMGYQRELQYRHSNGAFSAFGEGSGSDGSLWLTAFVVRVFSQAAEVGNLATDPSVLSSAAEFIASKQSSDGSFKDPSPPVHSEMSGGAGEGPGLAAYCLLAMVEAGRSAGNVDQTISFLEGSIDSGFGGSSYVAAISAHALTRACAKIGKGCDLATRARAKLLEMATADTDGTKHWGSSGAVVSSPVADARVIPYGAETSTEVEATAYAVLALVGAGDTSGAYSGARWLLMRRNARGGFQSTQDTVVALEALGAYAAATFSDVASLSVTPATVGNFSPGTITIDESSFDLMQRFDAHGATEVLATVEGSGVALMQLEVTYNLETDPNPPEFELVVRAKATAVTEAATRRRRRGRSLLGNLFGSNDGGGGGGGEAETVSADDARATEVNACVKRIRPGVPLGMVLLDVGLFTGFAPDEDSLADIRVEGKGYVNRVDADDRKVVFYLENTDSSEACVIFQATKMHDVKNLQAATSTVQAYYHPERKGTAVTDSGDIEDISTSPRRGGLFLIDGRSPLEVVTSDGKVSEKARVGFFTSLLASILFWGLG